jgi:outer membrane protein TolC
MSWKTWLIGLVLVVTSALGCRQQSFLTEKDYHDARSLPCAVPPDSVAGSEATPPAGTMAPPTTVDDTQRNPRYLSLREALAIALENGTVGIQNALVPGFAGDSFGGFLGRGVQGPDGIRVLALDPAIIANDIEISLSKFDTRWNTSLTWNWTESPLGISPTSFTQGGSSITSVTANSLNYNTALVKPLPTGGVAGITFGITSQHNTPASLINPAIQPNIQFVFEQPLLQGFGEEINQLRDSHPGSLLLPFPVLGQVEGILITRIRLDQQRAEFERNLNYLLLNVEAAYWNLYGAFYQLYSREEGVRYAYELWRLTKLGFDAGRATAQDLEQTRLQYEQFRALRLTALGQVLESERQLRGLLGLKSEDGSRLVPADSPTLTPVKPEWHVALDETLARRPELLLARQELKVRRLDLIREQNTLLPDLRFLATDAIHSVGSQLDGGRASANAFHQLVSDPFNNFSLGLQMNVPLGFRAAHAAVREAQLNWQRSFLSLRTEEDKSERFLALAYRQVFEFQHLIQVQQAALRAATIQLDRYYELFQGGRGKPFGADLILALQNWSNSVASYYAAIVQYNNALATFEFAKGTIEERDNVFISDGPLPYCAQIRAVDHERQRTLAIVLRDQAQPAKLTPCLAGPEESPIKMPDLSKDTVLSLPALQHQQPPVPELPEEPQAKVQVPPSMDDTSRVTGSRGEERQPGVQVPPSSNPWHPARNGKEEDGNPLSVPSPKEWK